MFLEEDGDKSNLFPVEPSTFEQTFEAPESSEPTKPVDDKPVPFHKDPKIQKFLERREREIEDRLMASLEDKRSSSTTPTADRFSKVINSFEGIIGNDTPEKVSALNSLKEALNDMDASAVRVAEEKINEIRDRDLREDQEAEQELENAFETIEDTFDVDLTSQRATKTRQEFITFVEKIAPKDRQGNIVDYPDMTSAWETFSEMKRATQVPSRAKELAARSISRSTETATQQPKRVTWDSVDEVMDNLK